MNPLRAALRAVPYCAIVLAIGGPVFLGPPAEAPPLSRGPGLNHASERTGLLPFGPVPSGDISELRNKAMARLGVLDWHKAGFCGQGVKVAVLDSGFHDFKSFLGTALPASVTVKSFRRDGNLEARDSQHGILCGEVIHALAPDAELLLVNWEPDRPESFLQAVNWARLQGAKVLSCSLIMPSWSDGEGGGRIHEGLAKIVDGGEPADAMLFFGSAGNLAQRHWSGTPQSDTAGYHLWTPGHRDNPLTPWGDERVSVELYGQACQNLELQVFESVTNKEVGRSRAASEGSPSGCPCAVVRFQPLAGCQYYLRLRSDKVKKDDKHNPFHLIVLGGALHYSTAAGSISFPADGVGVLAVGAVDESGHRLSYSSCGPNSRIPKPDYVAEVPFQSSWRDRPFAGTSAAAPQAAALATLQWSRNPLLTAKQINQALRQASCDLGPLGHDWETGHGLLRLPGIGEGH